MSRTTSAVFVFATLALTACEHNAPTSASTNRPFTATPSITALTNVARAMAPPPPVEISARQVRDELAVIATKTLVSEPGFQTRTLSRLGGLTIPPQANAQCHIDFDDPASIADLPGASQDMFATHYAQPCGDDAEVRVVPMQNTHFHLAYEDTTIACIDDFGMFGRGTPGSCTALADPSAEPRRVQSHDAWQTIKIYRKAFLGAARTFSMVSFVNFGDEPVTFRYRKGATWYEWGNLAGETTWNVGSWVVNVDEVQISHAFASRPCGPGWEAGAPGGGCPPLGGPFTLDNLRINP